MRVIYLLIFFIILASCTGKTHENTEANGIVEACFIDKTEKNAIEISAAKEPVLIYVNSKEGLRVRDTPSVTGAKLAVLEHKKQISITGSKRGSLKSADIIRTEPALSLTLWQTGLKASNPLLTV